MSLTGAQRQARYRAAQSARVAQLEAALRTAHAMLDEIARGTSFSIPEWHSSLGQIERALGKDTPRANNYERSK